MPVAVVKLGSSIVAEDTGALRLSVVARICEEVASLHASGVDVVVVTSGAIARGIHLLGSRGPSARGRGAAGRLRRRPGPFVSDLRRVPARARHPVRPGAAHVLRHERPHALSQRAPDVAQARRLADRAGHQRERHDDHRRDLLRRQRLPGRAGGRSGRRFAPAPADLDAGPVDRGPARSTPRRGWFRSVADPSELEALSIGSATSPLGSGGMRSKVAAAEMATAAGIPTVIGSGFEPGSRPRVGGGERPAPASPRTPSASPPSSSGCATPSPSQGRVVVDAGAARALRDGGDLAAAGRRSSAWTAASRPATRSRSRSTARPSARASPNYSAGELRRVMGLKSAEVRSVAPARVEEAVHRDYFVLV